MEGRHNLSRPGIRSESAYIEAVSELFEMTILRVAGAIAQTPIARGEFGDVAERGGRRIGFEDFRKKLPAET